MLTLAIAFISMAACFSQTNIKIVKPVSTEDVAKIESILKTFDPNTAKQIALSFKTTDGKFYSYAPDKGLLDVTQTTSTRTQTVLNNISACGPLCTPQVKQAIQQLSAILSKYQ